jgi:hypothetical protein
MVVPESNDKLCAAKPNRIEGPMTRGIETWREPLLEAGSALFFSTFCIAECLIGYMIPRTMGIVPRSRVARFTVGLVLLAIAGASSFFLFRSKPLPLPPAPSVEFSSHALSQMEKQQFLEDDFQIIKDVCALPHAVLQSFTEQGGTRLLMANPGEDYNATDVVLDSSLPWMRLVFAGVYRDRCFVYYEEGGIVVSHNLALYKLRPEGGVEKVSRASCGRAANLAELRSLVAQGVINAFSLTGIPAKVFL